MATRKNSSKGTAFAVRLAALVVLGAAAVVLVFMMRSPLTIDEDDVRQILNSGELVGMPVEEAASRLQHRPPQPAVTDGMVVFDFQHIRGWRASAVELEVRGGEVVAARWEGTGEDFLP
jgi:hypothetical protein